MQIKLNAWVNVFVGIAFAISAFSGFALLLNLGTRSALKNLHNYSSIALVVLIVIHLALHWNYLKCMPRLLFKKGEKCEDE